MTSSDFCLDEKGRVAYSINEVAEMFGKSRRTIHRWIENDIVQTIKIAGSTYIPATEIVRLLAEGQGNK